MATECLTCEGSGVAIDMACPDCNGLGKMISEVIKNMGWESAYDVSLHVICGLIDDKPSLADVKVSVLIDVISDILRNNGGE